MSAADHHEPQLPRPADDESGFEPALSGRARAAHVLASLRVANLKRIYDELGDMTVAEWWGGSQRGDLMAGCLPVGRPSSPVRRKLVRLGCRIARLTADRVPPRNKVPLQTLETAEQWTKGDSTIADHAIRLLTRRCGRAAPTIRGLNARLAAYAIVQAAELVDFPSQRVRAPEPRGEMSYWTATGVVVELAAAAVGDRGGEFLSECADIVRGMYPDIRQVLADRQRDLIDGFD